MRVVKIRPIIFALGIAGVLLSLAALIYCDHFRTVDTSDYLKQADEGVPWVQFGLVSALTGFALAFFGKRWWRIAVIGTAILLFVLWFFIAESLY